MEHQEYIIEKFPHTTTKTPAPAYLNIHSHRNLNLSHPVLYGRIEHTTSLSSTLSIFHPTSLSARYQITYQNHIYSILASTRSYIRITNNILLLRGCSDIYN